MKREREREEERRRESKRGRERKREMVKDRLGERGGVLSPPFPVVVCLLPESFCVFSLGPTLP